MFRTAILTFITCTLVTATHAQSPGQIQSMRWNENNRIDEHWITIGAAHLYGADEDGVITGIAFNTFASAAQGLLADSALQVDDIGVLIQPYSADLAAFALNGSAYYLDRGNHTGSLSWDVLTETPTTLSGYGITDAQSSSSILEALAALTLDDNKGIYATGADTFSVYDLSAAGRAFANAVGTSGTILYFSDDDELSNTPITDIARTLIDDNTAADMRNTLGVVIGTDVQAYDAGLASIAGLTTAANKGIYTTGSDVYATYDLTNQARQLMDDTSFAAMRTTLGLGTSDYVQFNVLNVSALGTQSIVRSSSGGSIAVNLPEISDTESYEVNVPSSKSGYIPVVADANGLVNLADGSEVKGVLPNARLADMAEATIKGRADGDGNGVPADLTASEVRTILNVEDGADVTDADNVLAALAVAAVDVDVNGRKVVDVGAPTGSTDAATKGYVDVRLPAGIVMPYAGASAPSGYLFCYGQTVSRTTYADLYAAIGTTYGAGDGSTTFALPDLRGRVPAGKDDMGGSAANILTSTGTGAPTWSGSGLGAKVGVDRHTLTIPQMPSHTHNLTFQVLARGNGGTGSMELSMAGGRSVTQASNSNTGGDEAHPIVQPSLILNYIIKY